MILLEDSHKMVRELLLPRLGKEGKTGPLNVKMADFDDSNLEVHAGNDGTEVFVSVKFRYGFADCAKYGLDERLASIFGKDNVVEPREGYDATVKADLAQASGTEGEKLVDDLASLKRHVVSTPFYHCCDAVARGEIPETYVCNYRSGEYIYLKPIRPAGGGELNVAVIFNISFKERTDLAMAEVFMKEFAEARRDPQLSQSPSVSYSKDAPGDIAGLPGTNKTDNGGFVRFLLFKRHYTEKKDSIISGIHGFRNYLHYHIKCSKAFMHMRMRKRVATWMQVLNRAKPEPKTTEKKTAAGKTFVRK